MERHPTHARHTYVTCDPQKIDAAISATTTEARHLLTKQPGLGGIALFAHRNLGKLLLGTLWDSDRARQDGEDHMRDRWATLLKSYGATISVEDFEVASVFQGRKLQPGAGMRRLLVEFDPAGTEAMIESFNRVVAGDFLQRRDFCRASFLVDRARGRAVLLFPCDPGASAAFRAAAALLGAEAAKKSEWRTAVRSLEDFEVILFEPVTKKTEVEGVQFDRFGAEILDKFVWPDEFERPSTLCNVS